MTQSQVTVLVIAILAVAAGVLYFLNKRRSERLRQRFGPEYQRTVETAGGARRGEARLQKLEKRVERFNIHPLQPAARQSFMDRWQKMQAKFVDDPRSAVGEADRLIGEVMSARGYPVEDFEQMATDLSVDHAEVIEHYRAGHQIALRHKQGQASTEDLRQALIHYRELFDELAGEPVSASAQAGKH